VGNGGMYVVGTEIGGVPITPPGKVVDTGPGRASDGLGPGRPSQ
jgi:hypothetical protein